MKRLLLIFICMFVASALLAQDDDEPVVVESAKVPKAVLKMADSLNAKGDAAMVATPTPEPTVDPVLEAQEQKRLQEELQKRQEREAFLNKYRDEPVPVPKTVDEIKLEESMNAATQAAVSGDVDAIAKKLETLNKQSQSGFNPLKNAPKNIDLESMLRIINTSFRAMKEEDLVNYLKAVSSGSFLEVILSIHSKSLVFVAKVLRDEEAMFELLDIIKDKLRLLFYVLVNIFTVFIGVLIKKFTRTDVGTIGALWRWFQRFVFINGLRVLIFFFFFHQEIGPVARIFKTTFLS